LEQFYYLRALADNNYCMQIREKMLEFSSLALPVPSPYHHILHEGSANLFNNKILLKLPKMELNNSYNIEFPALLNVGSC